MNVKTPSHSVLRDWLALVIVALACPLAVFGGTNIGCVGQSFSGSCITVAVVISPMLLVVAGIVAGVVTRGWTGLLIVAIGTVIGMMGILALSSVAGRPVPIDWFSGVVATAWFMGPLIIGYGIARFVARLRGRRREEAEDGGAPS